MKSSELLKHGFSEEVIDIWKDAGIVETLPVQDASIAAGLFAGKSLLIVSPTSSGKTFVGEMAAVHGALAGRKTLYLVPFKAIAEERLSEFTTRYSNPKIGFRCLVSDRDRRENDADILVGRYDIAVLTYEKLTALLVSNPGMLDVSGLVVVDEVQLIGDSERGGNLELLLTKIRRLSGSIPIVALSAVLGDLNGFDKWLSAEVIKCSERPLELRQGVIYEGGKFDYYEWNSQLAGTEELPSESLETLILHLVESGEQVVVVRNSVAAAQNFAKKLATEFTKLPAATNSIDELRRETDTETKDDLLQTLRRSIAFHHSDCELAERLAVENGFRDGEIKVISATTTLSMGINLPCKTVILADHEKWMTIKGQVQLTPWSLAEVRNIFGRAGRLGKGATFGRGILWMPNEGSARIAKTRYLVNSLEPLNSALMKKDIAERVLDVFATGFATCEKSVSDFIFATFAGLSWKTNEAREQIGSYIDAGIKKCKAYGLIEVVKKDTLQITKLGRICAAKQISIETFNHLSTFVSDTTTLDDLAVLYCCATCPEVDKVYYRGCKWENVTRRESITKKLSAMADAGELPALLAKTVAKPTLGDVPSLTITLLAHDILMTQRSTKEIRESFDVSGAVIRVACTNLSWMLDALSEIAKVTKTDWSEKLEALTDCIQHRCPIKIKSLLEIPGAISRDDRIRLAQAGVLSADSFLEHDPATFRGVFDPIKAKRISEMLETSRARTLASWFRDQRRRLDALGLQTKLLEDVYKLEGKRLEGAIHNLLATGFAGCVSIPITDQKEGEPDLLLGFPSKKQVAVQVTAKQSDTQYIDSKKAGDVIPQSARFHPHGYMCLGRPDFQALAKENAKHQGQQHNFKLLPLYLLAEMYVRVSEETLKPEKVADIIENTRGYLTVQLLKT